MAKQRSTSSRPTTTLQRAAHLYRLIEVLGAGPQKRDTLARRLGRGLRGFYRDLEALRKAGIGLALEDGRYALTEKVNEAMAKLPFPDPGLTFGEAQQLARGRSLAHRKLAEQIQVVSSAAAPKRKPQK
jgi:predicted DNA-binding transcriptional regulator YafY